MTSEEKSTSKEILKEKGTFEEATNRIFAILYSATYVFRIAFGATIFLIDSYLIYLYYAHYMAEYGSPPHPADSNLIFILILVALTYYLSESFSAGAIGYLIDYKDARGVIVASAWVGAIAMLSYSIGLLFEAEIWIDVAIFAIAHMIHGVAAAMKVTSTVTYIARHSTFENRGRHMGLYDFTMFLGRVSGIGFAGFLWAYFGTHLTVEELVNEISTNKISAIEAYHLVRGALRAFWVLTVFLIIAGIILLLLPKSPSNHHAPKLTLREMVVAPLNEFVIMFKERRDLAIPWFSMASLFGLILLWGPRVLQIEVGISGEFSGYIGAYIGLLLGLPAPLWGLVADRIGRKKTVAIGITGLILLVVILAVAISVMGIPLDDPMLFYMASPAIVFLAALGPSFLARLGDTSKTGMHGEVMAGYQFTLALGEINGILSGAVAIFIATELMRGSELEPIAGLIGVAILGLIYFLIMVIGALKIKPDEVVIKEFLKNEK